VIAIIAILAGILFPVFAGVREEARAAAARTELSIFNTAIHNYFGDEGTFPSNWNSLIQGGYLPNLTFSSVDDDVAQLSGYRFRLRPPSCDSCTAESPVIVEAKPLYAAISSINLYLHDDGKIESERDPELVKAQDKILADIKYDAAIAIAKAVKEFGGTDTAGAVNSVTDKDKEVAWTLLTRNDGDFDRHDMVALSKTIGVPACQEFIQKSTSGHLKIGEAGAADDVKVTEGLGQALPEDWFKELFGWDYFFQLAGQIEHGGLQRALLALGEAAQRGESRDPSNAGELYDAIEQWVSAQEKNGTLDTATAAKIREFLSIRRL
jgi:hypothetical protein